jgi:hypothetical protein
MEGKTPHEIDLAGTDGGMHARLAQALDDAARYIRTHPDLPIPASVELIYCIPATDDKAGEDEARRIAAIIGAKVTGDDSSEASLSFGPVSYTARYINRERMAAYNAHMDPYYATQAERRAAAAERANAIKDAARETAVTITGRSAA